MSALEARGPMIAPIGSWSSGPRASRSLMIMSERDARGPEELERQRATRSGGAPAFRTACVSAASCAALSNATDTSCSSGFSRASAAAKPATGACSGASSVVSACPCTMTMGSTGVVRARAAHRWNTDCSPSPTTSATFAGDAVRGSTDPCLHDQSAHTVDGSRPSALQRRAQPLVVLRGSGIDREGAVVEPAERAARPHEDRLPAERAPQLLVAVEQQDRVRHGRVGNRRVLPDRREQVHAVIGGSDRARHVDLDIVEHDQRPSRRIEHTDAQLPSFRPAGQERDVRDAGPVTGPWIATAPMPIGTTEASASPLASISPTAACTAPSSSAGSSCIAAFDGSTGASSATTSAGPARSERMTRKLGPYSKPSRLNWL